VVAELEEIRAAKASFEQRGIAVVTSSGILVTLLLGLAALITSRSGYTLPDSAKPWIYGSMAAFVLAAVFGVLTNRPVWLRAPTAKSLFDLARHSWDDDRATAEKKIYATRVKMLARYKKTNRKQAKLLSYAVALEMLAILLMAVAVGIIINHG
jgi:tetrahydromethanopterin S-methyltransferase subunit C